MVQCAARASNGPNHLGLCALQTYVVEFMPTIAGAYSVSVTVNDGLVGGAPARGFVEPAKLYRESHGFTAAITMDNPYCSCDHHG